MVIGPILDGQNPLYGYGSWNLVTSPIISYNLAVKVMNELSEKE